MLRLSSTALLTVALTCNLAFAAERELLEGDGLAAKYPLDAGIAKDAAVLFAEDFEGVTVADLSKRWNEASNKDGKVISLVADAPVKGAGEKSVQMTATVTANEGGHLYKKLPRGVDTAFARVYVKFPKDAGYIHHFIHFGGYNPATNWPQGGAGSRPRGDERMTVGIEPYGSGGKLDAPGAWNFYPYWHEMKASVGNRYWGNSIAPTTPLMVPCEKWQCVEIMMKTNTPGQRDGELALWLDGKLSMHVKKGSPRGQWSGMGFQLRDVNETRAEPFEGFSWRTSEKLKINFFWLLHYVTDTALKRNGVTDMEKPVTVWFDNVVVAEKYIGPVKGK
ncbi:MAG: hypothetical protein WD768_22185 [Phycisphaeraceae bacterium]